MLEAPLSSLPVQITGPREAVEKVLARQIIPKAQRHDCHAIVWIEAPAIAPALEDEVREAGCRLHYIQDRSA